MDAAVAQLIETRRALGYAPTPVKDLKGWTPLGQAPVGVDGIIAYRDQPTQYNNFTTGPWKWKRGFVQNDPDDGPGGYTNEKTPGSKWIPGAEFWRPEPPMPPDPVCPECGRSDGYHNVSITDKGIRRCGDPQTY